MGYYRSEITDEDIVFQKLNEILFSYFIENDFQKILPQITDNFFAVGMVRENVIQGKKEAAQRSLSKEEVFGMVTDYEIKNFTAVCRQETFIDCFGTIWIHKKSAGRCDGPYCINVTAGFFKEEEQYRLSLLFLSEAYLPCFGTIWIHKKSAGRCDGPYCINVTAGFFKEEEQYRLSLLFLSEAYLPEEFFDKIFREYKNNSYELDQPGYEAQDVFLTMLNDAVRDPLTGVYNRRSGEALIQKALDDETSYVFLVLDIDHFKEINDIYGHQEGDKVLQYTVQLMRNSFRGSDIIFRLGGDEFVIFAYPCNDLRIMEEKLQKMNAEYEKEIETYYTKSQSSLSFGGVFGSGRISFQKLYKKADQVLYGVKHSQDQNQMIRKIETI